jgi:transcriptional regulator with XRE-family HTH domain/NADH:ubiquinone oxidoreductase subunit K
MYLGRTAAVMIAAGIIRAFGSFVPVSTSPGAAVQLLYLLTDICILLGFIGWYAASHEAVGTVGFVAFVLGVVGILTIRSSAAFPNVELYPLGALVFEVGLNALALAAWKTHRLHAWVPSLLLLSVVAGVASHTSSDLSWLLMLSGVLFGIGAAGVGLTLRSAPVCSDYNLVMAANQDQQARNGKARPIFPTIANVAADEPSAGFGDLLRDHRRAAGLTQERLAERAGVSQRSISDIERGGEHVPRRDTVALLVRALGLLEPDRVALEGLVERSRRARTMFDRPGRTIRAGLPQHQTIRTTVVWSHQLLGDQEQVLLRRLSVFAGGWTLPVAEVVCSGAGIAQARVLDLLTQLVDKSMVLVDATDAVGHYRLLEPVRHYALERLEASGEAARYWARHAAAFLRSVARQERRSSAAANSQPACRALMCRLGAVSLTASTPVPPEADVDVGT